MASSEVSGSVVRLLEFASQHHLLLGSDVLDIGCGKGRNALALAGHGFRVSAFDVVEEAVMVMVDRARLAGVGVSAHVAPMDERWPFEDESFDLVLDDTASMSIGYEQGIVVCRSEMYRVLRPGGYSVIYSLAKSDPFLQSLPAGEELDTVVFPDGKIDKLYSAEDVRSYYSMFQVAHQEQWATYDMVGADLWERKRIWTLLKKPESV
jgi:ubiquinone/menaquinone biosynthesis C-methylase UbiE